ncbi:MAG: hydroxymethylglutaryl-CoA lyase [Rhodobacteraceae bacterium]|nr:hydroxymethylglutaryl-CoA lyase [Paracoccaceae bacterium]
MGAYVEIFEVAPRDGLQTEPLPIPTADKVALVDGLSKVGFRHIEVASFVAPKWVPQMADSAQVLAGIGRCQGVSYAALVPNMQGFARAMEAQADEIAIFGAASEGFSRANINASIEESLHRFAPVVRAALARGVPVRGYISCVCDCPYDGATPPAQVAWVARALRAMGCYQISLGDTLGRARPPAVAAMLEAVLQEVPAQQLAGHYHDTAGWALDNIEVSLAAGLRVFDASVAGLGGCPYAPGAAGNVATEKVHARLTALGFATGLEDAALSRAVQLARGLRARRGQEDQEDQARQGGQSERAPRHV